MRGTSDLGGPAADLAAVVGAEETGAVAVGAEATIVGRIVAVAVAVAFAVAFAVNDHVNVCVDRVGPARTPSIDRRRRRGRYSRRRDTAAARRFRPRRSAARAPAGAAPDSASASSSSRSPRRRSSPQNCEARPQTWQRPSLPMRPVQPPSSHRRRSFQSIVGPLTTCLRGLRTARWPGRTSARSRRCERAIPEASSRSLRASSGVPLELAAVLGSGIRHDPLVAALPEVGVKTRHRDVAEHDVVVRASVPP